jgi:hypothetical protein
MQWHKAALSACFVIGMEISIDCVTRTPRWHKTLDRRILQKMPELLQKPSSVMDLISRNRAACSTPRFAEYSSLFDR